MSIVIYQHGTGGPDVLEVAERVVPEPSAEVVHVRHEAVGLNYLDVLFRRGFFRPPTNPFVSGFEAAGVVTAVGSAVRNFTIGDRVGYYSAAGAYAAERLISPSQLVRIPDGTTLERAATLLAKGLTARMAIKQAYAVQPGDVLVVTGGAGAIGSIITRWAVALGATVIAVVGSRTKVAAARENGAAEVVVGTADLQRVVAAFTRDGVDAILDAVGGSGVNQLIPVVKYGGTIVSYGNAAGQANPDPALLSGRSVSVESPPLGQYLYGQAAVQTAVDELFTVADSNIFDSLPVRNMPLRDVQAAHRDLEERKTTGITLLTL